MVAAAVAGFPWLESPLRRILATQRAHALLLHGPGGVGAFELALAVAQGWLCEAADVGAVGAAERPCGRCASCRLVEARSHPDLMVLLPDAVRLRIGWAATDADDSTDKAEKAGKAKPSKDIKVEAIRAAVGFVQTTAARGRAKVLVLHPAERMNAVAANALLKTLEEPPGIARFVLSTAAPDALLPTIRSRCQSVPVALPAAEAAAAWLAERGIGQPAAVLAGTGGQPQDVLAWAELGIDGAAWGRVPSAVATGDATAFKGWPLPLVVESMQKLCHDALRVAVGALPRYFDVARVPAAARVDKLLAWSRELTRIARDLEHPWNGDLAVEALLQPRPRSVEYAAEGAPHRQARLGTLGAMKRASSCAQTRAEGSA